MAWEMAVEQSKRPDSNLGAMVERHNGCLPILGMFVITIVASFAMFRVGQFVYINAAYGRAAWEGGLRVVDNKGHLTNGELLSGKGHLIVYGGSFLLTAGFFLGAGFGLTYLSMRLRGERLGEQLRRWKEENPGVPP